MHTWVYTCVHTHIHLSSLCGPPVRSRAPVPLWFSALWYHAGQIFLSAWMTPWHGVYLDWQLVFIWIDVQRREKKRLTDEGSGHQERAPICPDIKKMGWQLTPGRGGVGSNCISSQHGWPHLRLTFYKRTINDVNDGNAVSCIAASKGWMYRICLQLVTKTDKISQPPHQDRQGFCLVYLYLHVFVFKWNEQYKEAVLQIAYPPALPREG